MSRIEEALEKAALMRARTEIAVAAAPVSPQNPPNTSDSHLFAPVQSIQAKSPVLVALNDPHSPIAEEYRKLKSVLVAMTRRNEFDNVLMVTSAISGEGKSITAVNLAVTLARELDHTVLLVDADLRKPSLNTYLGIQPTVGLADCLLHGNDLGEALVRIGDSKLSLLPAGRTVENPAELLSSQKMKELVDELRNRYRDRYVIIDTPPVLQFSESRSIGAMVNGVVLVVKEGLTTLELIHETLDATKESKLLGIVYNGASRETNLSKYGYGYYPTGQGSAAPNAKLPPRHPEHQASFFSKIFRHKIHVQEH